MNNFDLAETLIAVADCGSIYQAALRLDQTNAAISKKLTKLEAYLGVQLMHRGRKGVKLSEAGQRYYHEVKAALEQLATAELSVKQLKSLPQGDLKVVCNQFYAEAKILPLLDKFLKKYPKINLNLEIAEILPDFNLKKMDILFGVSLPGQDHLVQKKIDQTSYVLCASPDYFKKNGCPRTVAELLQHPFIVHGGRAHPQIILLDDGEELRVHSKLVLNNTQMIIQSALEGIGIIWTHKKMVTPYLKQKTLQAILSNHTQQAINIYAYYAYQKYHDTKIKVFLDYFS